MTDLVSQTARKVQDIVEEKGSVSLSQIETAVDASYNLIFLAIDRLASDKKILIIKEKWDYIISGLNNIAVKR